MRNEEGVRLFLSDVYELYLRVMLNQLQVPERRIIHDTIFDAKVRSLAKKHL